MVAGSIGFISIILILTVIIPLWIVFHYITRWKQMKGQELEEGKVAVDKETLEGLSQTAKKLEGRVTNLETLLDAEAPGWRDK